MGAEGLAKAPNENRWKASGNCRATSLDPGRVATKYRLNLSERFGVVVDSMKKQIAWAVACMPGRISKSFQSTKVREMIWRWAFPMSPSLPEDRGLARSMVKNLAHWLVSFSRATASPSEA